MQQKLLQRGQKAEEKKNKKIKLWISYKFKLKKEVNRFVRILEDNV